MHKQQITSIELDEFKRVVEVELKARGHTANIDLLFEEMLNRSGLFRVSGSSVEFRHLLLQEFFAGRGIPSKEFIETFASDDWWRRAAVFYFGQNPGDSESLQLMAKTLKTKLGDQGYNSAVTLGLALQACYLIRVDEKLKIFRDVIEGLASGKNAVIGEQSSKFPLSRFIQYYVFAKDSVALSVIAGNEQEIRATWKDAGLNEDEKDVRSFWLIIGLIESGALEEAERLVKSFRPRDRKLLLGIHLACFLVQHLRVSTKAEKQHAKHIAQMFAPQVQEYRIELLKEVRSELLELRLGQVKAIEAPAE